VLYKFESGDGALRCPLRHGRKPAILRINLLKTFFQNLFLVLTCMGLVTIPAAAQPIYTALHTFTPLNFGPTNSDGFYPTGDLLLSGNTLYGTASLGGSSGYGTGFTNLYNFTNGSDGSYPVGGLILSGNTLFGAANLGGSPGYGTVFAINTDGIGFTNLYSFTNGSDGSYPAAGLILSGNTLFGTTSGEGQMGGPHSGSSTIFAINTDGTGFTNLYNFTGGTNGADPFCTLILSGNTLYGTSTTEYGGVFAINTNGTGFTNLYNFTPGEGGTPLGGVDFIGQHPVWD
jgi:hypothetical protein